MLNVSHRNKKPLKYFILTALCIRILNLTKTKTFSYGRPISRIAVLLNFVSQQVSTIISKNKHICMCDTRVQVRILVCRLPCHGSQFRTVNLIYGGRWPLADSTRLTPSALYRESQTFRIASRNRRLAVLN